MDAIISLIWKEEFMPLKIPFDEVGVYHAVLTFFPRDKILKFGTVVLSKYVVFQMAGRQRRGQNERSSTAATTSHSAGAHGSAE